MKPSAKTPLLLAFPLLTTLSPLPASAALLYDNGSIITDPTAGPSNFAASRYSASFSTYGFSANAPIRLADNFTLTSAATLSSITLQAYITGTYPTPPTTSPLTSATLRIWRGLPDTGTLITTSTTLTSNTFSGIYRTTNSNPLEPNRPVFNLTLDLANTSLSPGEYWIDYSLTGAGNPFSPMVMDGTAAAAQVRNGNAMRKLSDSGDWVTLFGGSGPQGLDFPFLLQGSPIIPEPSTTLPLLSPILLTLRRHPRHPRLTGNLQRIPTAHPQ